MKKNDVKRTRKVDTPNLSSKMNILPALSVTPGPEPSLTPGMLPIVLPNEEDETASIPIAELANKLQENRRKEAENDKKPLNFKGGE